MRWRSAIGAGLILASLATVLLMLVPSGGPLHALVTSSSHPSSTAAAPSARPAVAPAPAAAVLPAPSGKAVPTAAGLEAALQTALTTAPLAGHTSVSVVDVITGQVLMKQGEPATEPASTLKLLTATGSLTVLGPQTRLKTRVVSVPGSNRIVLVGDGDATLASTTAAAAAAGSGSARPASLESLARAAASALKAAGQRTVRLSYDASLFSGPTTAPSWPSTYVSSGVVSPVTALSVDGGRTSPGAVTRSLDPPAAAAAAFTQALRREGVHVTGSPTAATAPAGAVPVASVSSPPVGLLVERMLTESDDDLAEALAHRAAVGAHLSGTFTGGALATSEALKGLGLDITGLHLVDGSGLSHADRVPARLLAEVLSTAASDKPGDAVLSSVLTGLPVSGWTGTLSDRFAGQATASVAGLVRAKTGTLGSVSALAGTVVDADGRTLSFALLADSLPIGTTLEARAALDEAAAAIAGCGCR